MQCISVIYVGRYDAIAGKQQRCLERVIVQEVLAQLSVGAPDKPTPPLELGPQHNWQFENFPTITVLSPKTEDSDVKLPLALSK